MQKNHRSELCRAFLSRQVDKTLKFAQERALPRGACAPGKRCPSLLAGAEIAAPESCAIPPCPELFACGIVRGTVILLQATFLLLGTAALSPRFLRLCHTGFLLCPESRIVRPGAAAAAATAGIGALALLCFSACRPAARCIPQEASWFPPIPSLAKQQA